MPHHKHHHAKVLPVTGDGKRRAVFLALLSAAIIFLFIVLPFWLLYKRSVAPPTSEAFGPAAPAEAAKPPPDPRPERSYPDDNDKPLKFK